jgi:RNA polymerase sigma factor (sigma-70 family)
MASGRNEDAWSSLVLLERYRDGDERAAEALFARYFRRLIALARGELSPRVARRVDPEDVVLSVFRSFFIKARADRFILGRGGDLWRLLASITRHKSLHQARRHRAARRSVTREQPLDQIEGEQLRDDPAEPSPEDAAALADELEHVFRSVSPMGRRALELRLQGASLAEIAREIGRSERTVGRMLDQVRDLLRQRLGDRTDRHRSSTDLVAPHMSDQSQSSVLLSVDDLLLQRMIGAGRMGKVYRAWQRSTSQHVAVKFLRKQLLHDEWIVQRFLGEARTVALLSHPHIVGVRGLGRTPGGSYFIVMDLVNGEHLALREGIDLVPPGQVVDWALQVCSALDHAHGQGVVHCDLKPANLLLDESGRIRVTDFGLARSLAQGTPVCAEIEGTPPFMAPEQVSRSWGAIDRRTDVFGLGAVMYWLLCRQPPWPGRSLNEVLARVIGPDPVIPIASLRPDLPTNMSEVCMTCLAKRPDRRFQSMDDLRIALMAVRAQFSVP